VEAEVLAEVEASNREAFLREFADEYLERSQCLRALRRQEGALRDLKRAAQLEEDAQKLADKAAKPKPANGGSGGTAAVDSPKGTGTILLINVWSEPVTVVVEGTAYSLEVAELKVLTRTAGPFNFEVQGSERKQKGNLESGKTVKIWIGIS